MKQDDLVAMEGREVVDRLSGRHSKEKFLLAVQDEAVLFREQMGTTTPTADNFPMFEHRGLHSLVRLCAAHGLGITNAAQLWQALGDHLVNAFTSGPDAKLMTETETAKLNVLYNYKFKIYEEMLRVPAMALDAIEAYPTIVADLDLQPYQVRALKDASRREFEHLTNLKNSMEVNGYDFDLKLFRIDLT